MAHRPAAIKSLRQDKKRRRRNKAVKSRLRTERNKLERYLERGQLQEAERQLAVVTKHLHKAAAKNVIHANKAARTQSRYRKRLNKARGAAE